MFRSVALPLLVVGSGIHAAATPVYLDCSLAPLIWKLRMNEQSGTVDWSVEGTERSGRSAAQFRPEKVTFQVLSATFVVDRNDLSIIQSVPDGINKVGICKIPPKRKRAF